MSFSMELPCALAETGESAGLLPLVIIALCCASIGVLFVFAARRGKSKEQLLRAFGAAVLVGGVLLAPGVSVPAAEASEAAQNCADKTQVPVSGPTDPNPMECGVLPEYRGPEYDPVIAFTEGDTSMEGFWDTGQQGSLGFGEHFETTVRQSGFGDWVSQVNAAGGTVELQIESFDQFVLAYDFWDLLDTYSWSTEVSPGASVALQRLDSDTAVAVGGVDIVDSISYSEFVQLVRDAYRDQYQEEMPDEYLTRLQQNVASLSGMRGVARALLPAQPGCPEMSVSYLVLGPARS